MAVPEVIPVRISSEAAGYLSLSPVEQRNFTPHQLVEQVLASTGKDAERIHEVLLRGSLVNEGARLRWEGFDAGAEQLRGLLRRFPDPQPERPFRADDCEKAVLLGRRGAIPIEKEHASQRRWFRKSSFWDVLLVQAEGEELQYARYCYGERADVYRAELPPGTAAEIERASSLLRYSALTKRIQMLELTAAELLAGR